MKYLVLVSHGGLAEGLKSSLAMFAGDKIDQVIAVGLKEGKSVDDFAHDFRQALSPLTDEDSVLTTAALVLEEQGKLGSALILGGMNLTMALTAVVMKDMMEGADLAQVILSEASTALQEFALAPVEGDDEEDDDI